MARLAASSGKKEAMISQGGVLEEMQAESQIFKMSKTLAPLKNSLG